MAREGNASTLAAYLDAGAPVDLTNEAGDTLVMLAAYHGNASTVRSLVARGADVNRANDKGQTPLAGAVFKGSDDIVRSWSMRAPTRRGHAVCARRRADVRQGRVSEPVRCLMGWPGFPAPT